MAFTDNYNRADENLEANANWTRIDGVAGAAKVVSNRLDIIDGSNSSGYYCPDQGTTDHYVQYTTAQNTADASAFHCCRLRDGQNFIGIRSIKVGGTTFEVGVYTRLAGTLTLQQSVSTAFSIGDVFRLECSGSTFVAKKNGTQFATGTIPSHLLSGQTNAGRVGICARGGPTTFWADDFEAGPLTTGRTGTLAVTIDAVTQSAAAVTSRSATLAVTIAAVTQTTVAIVGPFTDDFTRADSYLDVVTTASSGKVWTKSAGVANAGGVRSNQFACLTTDAAGTEFYHELGSQEQQVSFKILDTTANSFVNLRSSGNGDGGSAVGVRASGGNLQIYRHEGAANFTSLYNTAHSIASGDVLTAVTTGTTIEVKRGGTSLGGPITIGGTVTGTKAGLFCRQAVQNPWLDDYSAQIYVASLAVNGTLAVTIAAVTQSANSTLKIAGTLGVTIDPVTQAATAFTAHSGTLAVTIAPVTQAAAGALKIAGTLGITLDPVTQAANASVLPGRSANLAVTIAAVTSAAIGLSYPFRDSFNRSNENLEANPFWSHDGQITGAATVTSNVLRCATADATGSAYKAPSPGRANHYVQYVAPAVDVNAGGYIAARLIDRSNWLGVRTGAVNSGVNWGRLEVSRCVAGSLTNIYASSDVFYNGGDTIRLDVIGTNWTLYKNGALVTSNAIGDGTLTSVTDTGIVARTTSGVMLADDFETGPILFNGTLAATIAPVTQSAFAGVASSASVGTLNITIAPVTMAAIGLGAAAFFDTFNRADALLEASTTSSSGGTWLVSSFPFPDTSGGGAIRSNQLANLTTNVFGTEYSVEIGNTEQNVSFKILNTTPNSFVTLRSTGQGDGGFYVGVRASGSHLQFFRHTGASSFAIFYDVDHGIASGDVLTVIVTGSTIEARRGASLTGRVEIGDSFSGTKVGIHCRQAVQNPLLDDFSATVYIQEFATTGTLAVTIGPVTQAASGSQAAATPVPVTGTQISALQGNVTVFTVFGVFGVTGEVATISAGSVAVVAPSAFFDSFNRADANLEDSRTATSGSQWSWDGFVVGAGRISNNALKSNTTGGGSAYLYDLGNANQTVSFVVRSTAPNSFVMLRADSDQTKYVGVRVSGTSFQIYRNNFGFTQVYDVNHGIAPGDTLTVTVTGVDTLRLYKNSVLILNTNYGSTAFTGTRVGVHLRQAIQDPFIDDFSAERYLGDVDNLVNVTSPATLTIGQGSVSIPNPGTRLVSVTGEGLTISQGSATTTFTTSGIFADTFDRADADLEASPRSSSGGTWTHDGVVPGAMRIFNTLLDCRNSSTSTPSAYKTPSTGTADHFVEYRLPSMSVLAGPFAACRMTDKDKYIGVRAGAATPVNWGYLQVYRASGNVLTQLVQWGDATVQSNDTIKLGVLGTNFYLFRNGNLLSSGAIGDGTLLSPNTGIVARSSTGILFDDFRIGVFNPVFPTGEQMTASAGSVSVVITYTVIQEVTGQELTVTDGNVTATTDQIARVDVTQNPLTISQGNALVKGDARVTVTTGGGDFMLASAGTATSAVFMPVNVTGLGLTVSQGSVLRVDTQAKPAVTGELLLTQQGSVTVRTQTNVSVTNPALLTMSLTGVTVNTVTKVFVTGEQMTVSIGPAAGSTVGFTLHYKVNVTGEQMVINPGAVFITGIPVVPYDLGEGLMLAMVNWMGNR